MRACLLLSAEINTRGISKSFRGTQSLSSGADIHFGDNYSLRYSLFSSLSLSPSFSLCLSLFRVRSSGCVDSENLAYNSRGRQVGSIATPPLESSFKGNPTSGWLVGGGNAGGGGGYVALMVV